MATTRPIDPPHAPVSLFAGLLPVPGGVGVSEAVLTGLGCAPGSIGSGTGHRLGIPVGHLLPATDLGWFGCEH